MTIVIFYDDHDTARFSGRDNQCLSVDRSHAEQINDPNRYALVLKQVICSEGFENCDAGAHDHSPVLVTLSKNLAFPNFKPFVRSIQDRRIGAARPKIAGARVIRYEPSGSPGTGRI